MSTQFFRVCQKCLDKVDHIHVIDMPVADRWNGGEGVGIKISFDPVLTKGPNTILADMTGVVDRKDLITLGEILLDVGKGK
jgi:hypothetical protein